MSNRTTNKIKTKNDFNPVRDDKDGVLAKRMIWSTKSIELAIKGLNEGKKLIANPFYEGNVKLLKGDLVFERTDKEIEEWKKCKDDILYFAENYCKLLTPEGIKNVKLRDYQVEYLEHLMKNRLSIYLACRQCGKTTTSAIYLLHYILFNFDKNTLVVGNKYKTSREIVDKLKKIFVEVPYFLKPGIYKWNEAEIVLDNGCRTQAEATTVNSGIGQTLSLCLWDEAAHVAPNIIDKFYNNIFPTITAGKARFMITSTQNGYNLFYRLYSAAEAGENDYAPYKTNWDRVPEWNPEKKCWEKRDEAWHQRQVANYGSEEAFNAQFGTNFDVSANTLISQKILTKKRQDLVEFINKDLYGVPYSESFYWHPDYEPMESLKNDYIIITCDLAEGAGGDYTVFMFNKLKDINTNNTECVGYFRSNNISRTDYALALQLLCVYFMDPDKYLISLEYNTYGELFLQNMYDNMDNHLEISQKFDSSNFVKYYNESGTRYINGIKLTSGNKTSHCLLFKEAYERGVAENNSSKFMIELDKFCDDGTNHYKASYGHDDMVMAQVQLEFVKKTLQYKLLRGEFDLNQNAPTNNNIYNPFEQQWSMDDYYRIINNSNYYNGY